MSYTCTDPGFTPDSAGPSFFSGGENDTVQKGCLWDNSRMFSSKGLFLGSTNPADFTRPATYAGFNIFSNPPEGVVTLISLIAGAAGNLYTVEIVDDVTGGSEYAEVVDGIHIVIHIEAGVSNLNAVYSALITETDVTDIVSVGGSPESLPVDPISQTPFTGGNDPQVPNNELYLKSKMIVGDLANNVFPTYRSNDCAILEISSTTQGLLLPRMTSGHRDEISNPVEGLLVWVTTGGGRYLSLYDSNAWQRVPVYNESLIRGGNTNGESILAGALDANDFQLLAQNYVRWTISSPDPGNKKESSLIAAYDGNGSVGRIYGQDASGMYSGQNGGAIEIFSGSSDTGDAGAITIRSGYSGDGGGGLVTVEAGHSDSSNGGPLYFNGGAGGAAGGDVNINAGNGGTAGGNFYGNAGNGDSGGFISFGAGQSSTGNGGYVNITAGDSIEADGGEVYLWSGVSNGGNGGFIDIKAGSSDFLSGGLVKVVSGNSGAGRGGELYLGLGAGPDGPGVYRLGVGSDFTQVNRNIYQARVSTTDDTVTVIDTIPVPEDKSIGFQITIEGHRTGGAAGTTGDSATYMLRGRAKNIAGVVTLHDIIVEESEDQAGWDGSITVDGANITPTALGAIDNDINWVCVSEITGELE